MKVLNRSLTATMCVCGQGKGAFPGYLSLPRGAQVYGPFLDRDGPLALHEEFRAAARLSGQTPPSGGILISLGDVSWLNVLNYH